MLYLFCVLRSKILSIGLLNRDPSELEKARSEVTSSTNSAAKRRIVAFSKRLVPDFILSSTGSTDSASGTGIVL